MFASNGPYPTMLQHVEVPLLDIKECKTIWKKALPKSIVNVKRNICAGGENKDSCMVSPFY